MPMRVRYYASIHQMTMYTHARVMHARVRNDDQIGN
jgi:hypothetical protein